MVTAKTFYSQWDAELLASFHVGRNTVYTMATQQPRITSHCPNVTDVFVLAELKVEFSITRRWWVTRNRRYFVFYDLDSALKFAADHQGKWPGPEAVISPW